MKKKPLQYQGKHKFIRQNKIFLTKYILFKTIEYKYCRVGEQKTCQKNYFEQINSHFAQQINGLVFI